MKLVLTNDDGFDAPGLTALQQAASEFGHPVLIAPHLALSGCSHQVTTDRPIRVSNLPPRGYSVEGTPSDCVRMALLHLATDADWVLSGINDGGNLGVDTFMSGTVGAAREATLMGKRSIAISQYRRRHLPFEWSWSQLLTVHVLKQLMRRPLPARCFWNVNLPADFTGTGPLPDLVFCPLDPHPLPVRYEHVDGTYRYRSNYHERVRRLGADVDVCFSGRIAISLVALDSL